MSKLKLLANISLKPNARREDLDGVRHLVVPCVAIKEGVLNNIFYPGAEIESFSQAWNGVPVPVNHPIDNDGNNLTANSVDCENRVNIGRFYNVLYENNRLKGEIWINLTKAEKLGYLDLVNKLEEGEIMEVSTGLFGDTLESKGEYEGVAYSYVISNIRPDHLALLPNEKGACSVKDGCGAMRTNCGKCGEKESKGFWNKVLKFFKVNESSHEETRAAITAALVDENDGSWRYVIDVFDNYFIFEQENGLYKRSYTLDNKKAILVGESVEVLVERKYVPVSAEQTNKTIMNEKEKKALVDALALAVVANANDVTDEQKEKLAALPDDILANMGKQYKIGEGVEVKAAPVVNIGLGEDDKKMLERLKANENIRLANKRNDVVESNEHLTDAMVANMSEETLDALLANKSEGEAVYGIGGSKPQPKTNTSEERPSFFFANRDKSNTK